MNYDRIFAPYQYFWQVSQLLVASGMKFLAKVTVTSEDTPYHVGADFARSTSLFFHRPGKALIVQLELHECYGFLDGGDYDFHWSLEFLCEESYVLWQERLRQKAAEEQAIGIFTEESLLHEAKGAWMLLETKGLHNGGGYRGSGFVAPGWEIHRNFCLERETIDQHERMSPEMVVSPIITAVKQVEPTLSNSFHELSVWSFAPAYDFPGCEPLFWRRFPTRRLRLLADRIIGIKFQPD